MHDVPSDDGDSERRGVDFEVANYFIDSIPRSKLKELLKKTGLAPQESLRTKEEVYWKLKFGAGARSEDEILDLMVKYPDLIQRPIVEKGERAILARPAERIREIL